MTDWNLIVFRLVNGGSGHSWLLDSLLALALSNTLIKSAPIGALFLAAWFQRTDEAIASRRRQTLLLVLGATLLTVATTYLLSRVALQPRPYMRTARVLEFDGRELRGMDRWDFRHPLDNRARQRMTALQAGQIPPEDFYAFPSDHAGLFACLSLGLLMASRRLGVLACLWTASIILWTKVTSGMHAPQEVLAGVGIALGWLGLAWGCRAFLAGRLLERAAAASLRYPGLSAAMLFLVLFELVSTFDHAKAIASAVGKHW